MQKSAVPVLIASVLTWALLLVCSRALVIGLDLDPWMFTFLQMGSGGLFFIVISWGADAGISALRRLDTWLIGIFRIGTAALYMAALVHVDVLQAGFFGAIGVPVSAFAVCLLFSRRPTRLEVLGHIPLVAGSVTTAFGFDGSLDNPALFLLILSLICVLSASLFAERHPHMTALAPRTRLRLTGIVLLLTAVGFAFWRIVQSATGMTDSADLMELMRPELWAAALGLGITLRGLATYLGFRAAAVAGTHNYLAAVLILPMVGAVLEGIVANHGYGPWPEIGPHQIAAGVLIVSGGTMVIYARKRAGKVATQAA
ncbi:EamA family transporter [Nisaea nitritireducens]|uniref:EamA family transporter n=1 Tax=Nisaea nitritireducens TaxID=568392 RepID=UPI001866770E|nr:EamA family transporter [Nisaea nitritireducens]